MPIATKCGCCNGVGKVFMHRPTTGPSQIEDCYNCQGSGYILNFGDISITFKYSNELPAVKYKESGCQ